MIKEILVNSEPFPWEEGLTVSQVIERKRYIFKLLVVKIDDEVIRKPDWPTTTIPEGANVQVIHLMSGG
jgi:sulfur carrier protein